MQTNQSWQAEDSKITAVEMPSNMPTAEGIATAGSAAYSNKDMEQENVNKTVSDTHITLAEACAQNCADDDTDGANADQQ